VIRLLPSLDRASAGSDLRHWCPPGRAHPHEPATARRSQV